MNYLSVILKVKSARGLCRSIVVEPTRILRTRSLSSSSLSSLQPTKSSQLQTAKSQLNLPTITTFSQLLTTSSYPRLTNTLQKKKINMDTQPETTVEAKVAAAEVIDVEKEAEASAPAVVALAPDTTEEVMNTEEEDKENSKETEEKMQTDENAAVVVVELEDEEAEKVTAPKLLFAKLSEHASAPTKGSKFSAGYDLMSAYEYVVPKRGKIMVKTDIQIQLPVGTYGRVAPRSGLALKNAIDVGAGVIDSDYRGNVGVILFNHSDEDFTVNKGDRIAQLICEKICYPTMVEVDTLEDSERGMNGFGSTGKRAKIDPIN